MDTLSLSDLLRSDCEDYNDAVSRLWYSDERMRNDPGYAVKRAENLYGYHSQHAHAQKGPIRPQLLKEVIANSNFLPWLRHDHEGRPTYQYITVIIDTAGLHCSELELFESVFGAFEFHNDPDFRQLSYVGMKVRTDKAFNDAGLKAAKRIVKDSSLRALSKGLDKKDRKPLSPRPLVTRWFDRLTLAYQ